MTAENTMLLLRGAVIETDIKGFAERETARNGFLDGAFGA